MRRRNGERIGEIVEAAVRRLVAGQEWFDVEVEVEQVANRVVVLRAIETMHGGDAARIRIRFPCSIDFSLELARDSVIGRAVGTRSSLGRHRAGAKLRNHLFPDLHIRSGRSKVQTFEIEFSSPESLVMTGDAVPIDDGSG